MNPTIKALWLAALLSGEYQQGRHTMRDGDCFCPLGVLCDLYIRHTGRGEWAKLGNFDYFRMVGQTEIHDGMPPDEVLEWAGLDKRRALGIQRVNDGVRGRGIRQRPQSFPQVADHIRICI